MRETIASATHWLVLVCNHFEVDIKQLPEEPDSGMKMPEALDAVSPEEAKELEGKSEEERKKRREQKEWDVVWELVLISLGLVGAGQQGGEKDKSEKQTGTLGSAASKVSGLFSSSKSPPTSPDPSKPSSSTASVSKDGTPPPLAYTALSRSLVVSTASVLGIAPEVVSNVEHAIAQFLYLQLQQDPKAREKAEAQKSVGEGKEGGKEWDEAAQEYREKAAKKGSALKWAATGAGFVLGGVAIGLTGGASCFLISSPLFNLNKAHFHILRLAGLAAPALAPVLAGTFGIAAFSGAGGAVLIGTLLGLGGGGLAGYRTHRRMKGLESVSFEPIQEDDAHELPQIPSLTATSAFFSFASLFYLRPERPTLNFPPLAVVASGFLLDLKDSVDPWRSTFRTTKVDAFALKADPQSVTLSFLPPLPPFSAALVPLPSLPY
jgi:hypothetical protein